MAGLILTPATDPAAVEREAHEHFVRTHSAKEYRGRLNGIYAVWHAHNARCFGGALKVPHLSIGRTAPRRFSQCRLTTDYGGAMSITLSEGIVFGTNTRVVRVPYPSEGYRRFESDLVLAETVRQFCIEVLGEDEDGYGGYGPRFAAEATRIGENLGLPEVRARRRGYRGSALPVAAFWPYAFRPEGYYLGHIRLADRSVAGLRVRPPARVAALPGVYEFFLYLLVTGRLNRLRTILEREVDADREVRRPALAVAERGPHAPSGEPLPLPMVHPDWLAWNFGCVRSIALSARERRAFDVLPILADALEEAGCDDRVLLDHCRLAAEHTSNCWALKLLTGESSG